MPAPMPIGSPVPTVATPPTPPAGAPGVGVTDRAGHQAMGMALIERSADMLRIAIPLLRGSDLEEPAVKMLSLAIKALPATTHDAPVMPQSVAPPMAQAIPTPPVPPAQG